MGNGSHTTHGVLGVHRILPWVLGIWDRQIVIYGWTGSVLL